MYYKESNIEPVLLTYQVPLKLPTVAGSFTPPIEYIIEREICCKILGVFWNGTPFNCFSASRKKWIRTDWVMLTQILNIMLKNNLLKSGKIFDNLWPIGCRNTLNVFLSWVSCSYTSSLSSTFISLCCMFKRELWVYRNDYLMPRKHWAFVTLALGLSLGRSLVGWGHPSSLRWTLTRASHKTTDDTNMDMEVYFLYY